jgi:hypothetical protein
MELLIETEYENTNGFNRWASSSALKKRPQTQSWLYNWRSFVEKTLAGTLTLPQVKAGTYCNFNNWFWSKPRRKF